MRKDCEKFIIIVAAQFLNDENVTINNRLGAAVKIGIILVKFDCSIKQLTASTIHKTTLSILIFICFFLHPLFTLQTASVS